MADWRYLSVNAQTGAVLAELPLAAVVFSNVLSGTGSLSATIPASHLKSTGNNLQPARREITVVRNGVPVWNGPITSVSGVLGGESLEITARSTFWYLTRRYVEIDKSYAAEPVTNIVGYLIAEQQAKTSGGIYSLTTATTGSPASKTWDFSGASRRNVGQTILDLAASPDTGFDFTVELAFGTGQQVTRALSCAAPSKGALITSRVLDGPLLAGLGFTEDAELGANRVHVIGANTVKSLSESSSFTAGKVMLEEVFDHGDLTSIDVLTERAREYRRLLNPPVTTYTASFQPSAALPWRFYSLGDTVRLRASGGYLTIDAVQRVVEEEVRVDPGGSEVVTLTLNPPI